MAENIARKQRGRPFQPGQSGNPAGKPKGARHASTLAMEALLDGEAQALTRKAIELALAGDIPALRLCLERTLPPRKDRPLLIELPAIESTADVVKASAAIVSAVATGQITPAEASELSKVIDTHTRAIETHELSERIARLESQGGGK